MATTNPSVCEAFASSFPYWHRFQENVARLKGSPPFIISCHAFGKSDEETLNGKANRGFAFGTTTVQFPQTVLIRGDAASCHLVIVSEETGKRYIVGVRQRRIAVGCQYFLEDVAGMLDILFDKKEKIETINIASKIQQEIYEELGLKIDTNKLINLSKWQHLRAKSIQGFLPEDDKILGMVPSAGGCDEQVIIFGCTLQASQKFIDNLRNKQAGNNKEHELTTICIYPEEEALFLFKDSKFFTGHCLMKAYEEHIVKME